MFYVNMILTILTLDLSHRKGHSQLFSEKGVCLVYLDMWPVNLTDVTKEHVLKKCPGMIIRYVPAGGTGLYQVNEGIFTSFLPVVLFPVYM